MISALRKIPIRRGITFLMTLLTLGILVAMIYRNRENLSSIKWQIRPIPILGAALTYCFSVGLAAVNWGSMMRTLGSPAPWHEHITIYYISLPMSRLPLPLGYVAGRLLFYDEQTSKITISFASGLELALILLAAAGLSAIFWPGLSGYLDWKLGVVILILFLTAIHPRVLNRLLAWLKVQNVYHVNYAHTLTWLAVSIAVWFFIGCGLYLMIVSIYPLPVTQVLLIVGAWSLSNLATTLMAFLPVGLGLRELAFGALLSLFMPPGVAALVAILSRVFMTVCEVLMAGIAFLVKKATDRSVTHALS